MSYARNIKEMLNIPAGSRNVATNGYSGLTDSQLFFGSQFWHEQSQGMSQEMSLSSRNSQQSSQDGSDPKFLNRYTSKPNLFGDLKDKARNPNLLDKFEEDRKKAKEKSDSDQFLKESQHIRETLINIQQLVAGAEKNTTACQTIFNTFESFASSLKNSLERFQKDISQMFETLVDKLSSQKDVMTELEDKLQKNGESTAGLETQLKNLSKSLECLREEQEREQKMLEGALTVLSSLVPKPSDKPGPKATIDSAVQTSPEREQSVPNILENSQIDCIQLPCEPYDLKGQVGTSLQVHSHVHGKRRLKASDQRRKKRPLVVSQRRNQSVPNENVKPKKPQIISGPLHAHSEQSTRADQQSLHPGSLPPAKRGSRTAGPAGRFITPLSCWSQDSNSSECLAALDPILEKLSAESKSGAPEEHAGFWELFDSELGF